MNGTRRSGSRPASVWAAWKTPVLLAVLGLASLACSKGPGSPDLPNSPPRPKVQAQQVQSGPIVTAQFHLPARQKPRRALRT
ncbi:hypothetical protein RY831_10395 [Noviherbaspirillum sp. CPCC 100848]|uniref:Uncharacterized protein n=1 Tax=Noviherbaspirillum album TaxID=3080276 RepID=A0ABU6J7H5_9BURK|nr:hypothetical protein [Noviherbaspirillum sp. CPCC 100848]MEC4719561.1 hypothetical protein [Noviherbaspirillum sp. CPCC 100848]